jgi:hypothetical protein
LSGELSDSIADFVPHGFVAFSNQRFQQLSADEDAMFLVERHEHVDILRAVDFSGLGRYPAKYDSREGAQLVGEGSASRQIRAEDS